VLASWQAVHNVKEPEGSTSYLFWVVYLVVFVMSDARLRVRVERLLRGDLRTDDLSTLFLALRDRSNCAEVVSEIGDFVAHQDERTKGITTRSVRDFFTTLKFQVQINFRGVRIRTSRLIQSDCRV
jgi:hypothetical protein